jgi:hypothetical protein
MYPSGSMEAISPVASHLRVRVRVMVRVRVTFRVIGFAYHQIWVGV